MRRGGVELLKSHSLVVGRELNECGLVGDV